MRIARLKLEGTDIHAVQHADGEDWLGILDPFASEVEMTGARVAAEDAVFLAPVQPTVVIGIAHNRGLNDAPLPIQAWFKSPRSIAAHGDAIHAAREVGTVNIEGELAVVIGTHASKLTLENAFDAVLGYTIANDVTNIDQVPIDNKNFQAKAGVNYTPLGPWIETSIADPENVATTVAINGEVHARSGSFNLASTVAESLVYATAWVDLGPGDVVMTGAPATFLPVSVGDLVEITLDGIGTLSNTIR